ncbi:ATP-binding protein [Streptomyces sp. So13.3]|uniref:ATP-binding protein n=1 Tax=Streptomyces TaxID=1883 RepID=UPI0011065E13|nr:MULTISPECIES: ATP-binding protein [Streptomyces]MCZ4097160.1 ATP-binding protein [Streptomyces sp. H39-C1]QNA76000.1 ATP-binding protein [Streptomyces sp. So13.3]
MYDMAEVHGPPTPGFYLRTRPHGFVVHLVASGDNLRAVRELTRKTLASAGVDTETAESAQLVLSELVGNSVRACGEWVPLVVELSVGRTVVVLGVHDPDPARIPRRRAVAMDDADAESGRGLALVDLLTSGWRVARSPVGKQVRCRLELAAG